MTMLSLESLDAPWVFIVAALLMVLVWAAVDRVERRAARFSHGGVLSNG